MSRPAPFSMRLTVEERNRLEAQAGNMTLASYVKSVVFASEAPIYRKRQKPNEAIAEVAWMRVTLMKALGIKS